MPAQPDRRTAVSPRDEPTRRAFERRTCLSTRDPPPPSVKYGPRGGGPLSERQVKLSGTPAQYFGKGRCHVTRGTRPCLYRIWVVRRLQWLPVVSSVCNARTRGQTAVERRMW